MQEGLLAESENELKAAIELAENKDIRAEAHALLSNLYKRLGKPDEAINELQKAITLSPNKGVFHNNLGMLLVDLDKFEKSIKEFEEAIRLNPEEAAGHSNLGSLLKCRAPLKIWTGIIGQGG